jgi:hypothetical protein
MKTQSQIQIPCDVCGKLVRLWSDGTIVDHRNKRTHHRCKGSGTPKPQEQTQVAS